MKNSLFKSKLSFFTASVCMIAFLTILLLTPSCKKDFDNPKNGETGDLPGSNPVAHVLKEPYILYNNNPTSMGVIVHTSHEVSGSGWPHKKKVEIQWKYNYESDYHGYFDMDHHKFVIPWEYGKDHEDYYVWIKNYPNGHFHPGHKIDYEVRVTYNIEGDTKKYHGSFYTNDPNAETLTFYAISDTQEDGSEHNCNDKKSSTGKTGGGPEYFVRVMNSLAEDMDKDYANRYKLLLHCGDFNFNGPREYFYPQHNPWNKQFFGTTANNCCNHNRDKVMWILARVPVMATVGNHDWMWDQHPERSSIRDYVSAFPYDMYWERDKNISIGKACDPNWDYKKHPEHLYYSFDYGPAHFISLSTFPADKNDQSIYFGHASPQRAWLEDDLAKNTKEWIFVFTHIPIVSTRGPNNHPVFNTCEPLFQLYGVDAVLQGHHHFYMRKHQNGIPYLTLGGGGAFLMQWDKHEAEVFEKRMWFWSRFDILNNDSCKVLVKAAYDWDSQATSDHTIDTLYIYNRQRK